MRERLAAAVLVDTDPATSVVIVAERRLGVAALSALLMKDSAYRLAREAHGIAEVQEAVADYRPAVIVEDGSCLSGRELGLSDGHARRLAVDSLDDPAEFAGTVRQTIEQAGRTDVPDQSDPLSGREREILSQIASGRSTKEVARSFAITPKTVGNHVSNIFHKLDLHHRGELVLFALEQGLV
ncbi:MAG: response regulator transcription factor [Chloroflexi bacterium]|nr:MAG: response regulator transcription factor [Chloroflexota bacterium]